MAEQFLKCPTCGKTYRARQYDERRAYACKRCGTKLEPASRAPGPEGEASLVSDSLAGTRIGPYEILEKLGEGGMGVVYKARHETLQRMSALKVLPPDNAKGSQKAVQRFLREARSAAVLKHPNIVTVYHVGEADGWRYIDMEFVDGESLQERLSREGRLDAAEATRIVMDVCAALAAAHAKNIVHRDVKPANVLLGKDGTVKVADFGLAKSLEGEDALITAEGAMLGTPLFMSPEQCDGLPLDPRSDIYSLGVTYYYLLTGEPPFKPELGDSTGTVAFQHRILPVPDPRALVPSLPEGAVRVIRKAMAKKREERYKNCEEMAADLAKVLAGGGAQKIAGDAARVGEVIRSFWTEGKARRRAAAIVFAVAAVGLIGWGVSFVTRRGRPVGVASHAGLASGPAAVRTKPPVAKPKNKWEDVQQIVARRREAQHIFALLKQFDETPAPPKRKAEKWAQYLKDFESTGYEVAFARERVAHWRGVVKAEAERRAKLAAARRAFAQAKQYEESQDVGSTRKAEKWAQYLKDFESTGYEVTSAKERLQHWMEEAARRAFAAAKAVDQSNEQDAQRKADAWRAYLQNYASENYEVSYAKERLQHWEEAARQEAARRAFAAAKAVDQSDEQDMPQKADAWARYLKEFESTGYKTGYACMRMWYWRNGGKFLLLPPGFEKAFMLPDSDRDQHGNPVVKRNGSQYDPATGWPYEIWLKSPRMEFVLIPAGEFMMGSPDGEDGRDDDEGPVHRVRITKPFYLGKYEVTNGQYRAFDSSHDSKDYEGHSLNGDAQPVVCVSWNDAAKYCEWLTSWTGVKCALPTEAQWEYACRAGTRTSRYWGDGEREAGEYANVADRTAKRQWRNWAIFDTDDGYAVAAPVGKFKPNGFGLYDMLGNVWEWCRDWYDENYYSHSPPADPAGPSSGRYRVVRGGSWGNNPGLVRSANRNGVTPHSTDDDYGFRLAVAPR